MSESLGLCSGTFSTLFLSVESKKKQPPFECTLCPQTPDLAGPVQKVPLDCHQLAGAAALTFWKRYLPSLCILSDSLPLAGLLLVDWTSKSNQKSSVIFYLLDTGTHVSQTGFEFAL